MLALHSLSSKSSTADFILFLADSSIYFEEGSNIGFAEKYIFFLLYLVATVSRRSEASTQSTFEYRQIPLKCQGYYYIFSNKTLQNKYVPSSWDSQVRHAPVFPCINNFPTTCQKHFLAPPESETIKSTSRYPIT